MFQLPLAVHRFAPMRTNLLRAMGPLLALALLAGAAGPVEGRTWHVRKDGTGDFTVIQAAIDQAAAGDTIRIGPGRYSEHRPFGPPSGVWSENVYVAVTVSELTLIGEGREATIIGPPSAADLPPGDPIGVCAFSLVRSLTILDLTIEYVPGGVYRSWGGTMLLDGCRFRDCFTGIVSWGDGGTEIAECEFIGGDTGIFTTPPARDVNVRRCTFRDYIVGASFSGTANAVVTECEFTGGRGGAQWSDWSTGLLQGSRFTDQENYSVVAIGSSELVMNNNTLAGVGANLAAITACVVSGSGNTFMGGSYATIECAVSVLDLHDNDILHGTGPTIRLGAFVHPPVVTLDMSGNYWGTSDPALIAQWILDGRDDPAIHAIVQYEPFANGSVPVETRSWGEVKALYQGER